MGYDVYFAGEGAKFMFALLHTDREIRTKLLGITKSHYENKDTATRWKTYVEKSIRCADSVPMLKTNALKKLNELYENMIRS